MDDMPGFVSGSGLSDGFVIFWDGLRVALMY